VRALRRNVTEYGFRKAQKRAVRTRDVLPRILIVCEGEKTEPNYFRSFRAATASVIVVGTGSSTTSLVEEAVRLRDLDQGERRHEGIETGYDHVWCVFDKDSFTDALFNEAIRLARDKGLRVAYSNEAFELWYLLHFDYHDAALSRDQYGEKLKERLGHPYAKNSTRMYEELLARQEDAIRNAGALLRRYDPHNPAKDNPCTTVHLLVAELNKWFRR